MSRPPDRRFEPRLAADTRALVIAPGLELACRIVDRSGSGLKIKLDRPNTLPRAVTVIEIGKGVAIEAEVAWSRGQEAGLKTKGQTALTGLVPSRLTAARDAWRRMTGR